MILYLIIIILLSLSIIFSMRYCLKTFDKLELIGLFIFCSSTHQQFFYFFSSMFKFVDMLEQYLPDTIIRIDYSLFSPSLLVWTLCLIVRTRSQWLKLLIGLIWVFDYMYGVLGDYLLALKPFDLYDTFDQSDAELGDILLHVINYPGTVIVFICIYALTKPRGLKKVGLILIGALIGTAIEFIGVEFFHLFLLKNWSTFYSFLFYLVVFVINFFIYDKVHEYILKKRSGSSCY